MRPGSHQLWPQLPSTALQHLNVWRPGKCLVFLRLRQAHRAEGLHAHNHLPPLTCWQCIHCFAVFTSLIAPHEARAGCRLRSWPS